MKNLSYLCIALIVITLNLSAQEYNQRITEPDINQEIIIDYCTVDVLEEDPFAEWYFMEKETYEVDFETLEQIDIESFANLEIKMVMASWCHDSQREVPRFIKILENLNYDLENLVFVAVNRKKESEILFQENIQIQYVPTFIFYHNGEEIGRIIERPEISLEQDILSITLQTM